MLGRGVVRLVVREGLRVFVVTSPQGNACYASDFPSPCVKICKKICKDWPKKLSGGESPLKGNKCVQIQAAGCFFCFMSAYYFIENEKAEAQCGPNPLEKLPK